MFQLFDCVHTEATYLACVQFEIKIYVTHVNTVPNLPLPIITAYMLCQNILRSQEQRDSNLKE